MPPKPKVPFALHDAMSLSKSLSFPDAARVLLSPTGALAATRAAEMDGGSLDIFTTPDAAPVRTIDAPDRGHWDAPCWSRDGARWAAANERWDDDVRRGRVLVGDVSNDGLICEVEVPRGAPIAINDQGQSGALVALSPDAATVAWRARVGDRAALTLVDIAQGREETTLLPSEEHDLFAHTYSDDGGLYTVSSSISAHGGVARWQRGRSACERRWEWAAGCAIVAARDGVWSLGGGGVAWRVGPGRGGAFVPAKALRLQRARALRARATHKWDVAFLDNAIARIEKDQRTFCWGTNTPNARWGPAPEPCADARCFDLDLLWECGYNSRFGDDGVIVSDGVSVSLLRERGDAISWVRLLDDTERCSPRARRIVGVTASGNTVAVLWKKSAKATVLSLFDVDLAGA